LSQGSGFVAHKDGKVGTNYHVIRGAGSAVVKFPGGSFYNAEGFPGIDPGRDIAILKISSPSREFPSPQLADASEVTVGQHVVAIGSPMSLENTVSDGCASSKHRDSITKSIPAHVFSIVGLIRIHLQRERSSK
jgi:S1-C subfamily serine protease